MEEIAKLHERLQQASRELDETKSIAAAQTEQIKKLEQEQQEKSRIIKNNQTQMAENEMQLNHERENETNDFFSAFLPSAL